MSYSGIFSTLQSSDHDFIAALRFLGNHAKHIYEGGHQHQVYRQFVPRFDLEQHEDTYELYGELPGFRREDVIIEANDDRSLQISGSISGLTSQPPPPSSESKDPKDTKDSAIEQQDRKPTNQVLNGKEQRSSRKSASSTKACSPPSDRLKETTTNQERYLNARFGDVLDPFAQFIHGKDDTGANPEGTENMPKVRYLISEIHPCSFHRAFHFPTPVKRDQVTATMQDGILHITAPRAPMPPPVKVQVMNGTECCRAVDF